MSTAATPAKGTILKRGDGGGPETFTTIGEQTKITGPNYSQTLTEVTSHDSPSFFEEWIAGKRAAGEVSIEGNYLTGAAPQQVGLLADLAAGTKRNFQLSRPISTPEVIAFAAFVKSVVVDHPFNGALGWKCVLQITSLPTVTGGLA